MLLQYLKLLNTVKLIVDMRPTIFCTFMTTLCTITSIIISDLNFSSPSVELVDRLSDVNTKAIAN